MTVRAFARLVPVVALLLVVLGATPGGPGEPYHDPSAGGPGRNAVTMKLIPASASAHSNPSA